MQCTLIHIGEIPESCSPQIQNLICNCWSDIVYSTEGKVRYFDHRPLPSDPRNKAPRSGYKRPMSKIRKTGKDGDLAYSWFWVTEGEKESSLQQEL
jgi:hypothetical protein